MRRIGVGLVVGFMALIPVSVQAQTAWDSPLLLPPNAGAGLGVYLVDLENSDIGALVTWRSPGWNFGIRGGIADGGNDVAVVGGIDFNGMLTRSTDEFPLDIDWVLGAGLGIEDFVRVSAPIGLSVGHTFEGGDGVTFLPFATPRLVLDALMGDDDLPGRRNRDDVYLDFCMDFGLDIGVRRDFLIRFSATIGDREAVAIGLVF